MIFKKLRDYLKSNDKVNSDHSKSENRLNSNLGREEALVEFYEKQNNRSISFTC